MTEALVDKKESKDIVEKSDDTDITSMLKKIEDIVSKSELSKGDKEKILPGIKKFGYEIIELDIDGNRKN